MHYILQKSMSSSISSSNSESLLASAYRCTFVHSSVRAWHTISAAEEHDSSRTLSWGKKNLHGMSARAITGTAEAVSQSRQLLSQIMPWWMSQLGVSRLGASINVPVLEIAPANSFRWCLLLGGSSTGILCCLKATFVYLIELFLVGIVPEMLVMKWSFSWMGVQPSLVRLWVCVYVSV